MKLLKWIGVAFAGIVVFVIAVGIFADAPRPRTVTDAPAAPTTPAQPASGVTMANYQRLSPGMSYATAVEILGPGEEMSRSELAGTTTVMYMWKHWTGANMNAMFQNDHLVNKAQFGLK